MKLIEPTRDQVLAFCARSPVERVFLDDVARRGLGSFLAVAGADGELSALCHAGANLVPSGDGCAAFAAAAGDARSRMIIGEARAVTELWDAARGVCPSARGSSAPARLRDRRAAAVRRHRPARCDAARSRPAGPRLRRGTRARARRSTRWRATPTASAGARRRRSTKGAPGSGWRTTSSSSRRRPPPGRRTPCRCSRSGSIPRRAGSGYGARGLRDLCRLLLEQTPVVTLFVRTENAPAIALYEAIGMRKALEYRTILFLSPSLDFRDSGKRRTMRRFEGRCCGSGYLRFCSLLGPCSSRSRGIRLRAREHPAHLRADRSPVHRELRGADGVARDVRHRLPERSSAKARRCDQHRDCPRGSCASAPLATVDRRSSSSSALAPGMFSSPMRTRSGRAERGDSAGRADVPRLQRRRTGSGSAGRGATGARSGRLRRLGHALIASWNCSRGSRAMSAGTI